MSSQQGGISQNITQLCIRIEYELLEEPRKKSKKWGNLNRHTHTHTHTKQEKEKENKSDERNRVDKIVAIRQHEYSEVCRIKVSI